MPIEMSSPHQCGHTTGDPGHANQMHYPRRPSWADSGEEWRELGRRHYTPEATLLLDLFKKELSTLSSTFWVTPSLSINFFWTQVSYSLFCLPPKTLHRYRKQLLSPRDVTENPELVFSLPTVLFSQTQKIWAVLKTSWECSFNTSFTVILFQRERQRE